jgi:hypothetical protein
MVPPRCCLGKITSSRPSTMNTNRSQYRPFAYPLGLALLRNRILFYLVTVYPSPSNARTQRQTSLCRAVSPRIPDVVIEKHKNRTPIPHSSSQSDSDHYSCSCIPPVLSSSRRCGPKSAGGHLALHPNQRQMSELTKRCAGQQQKV